MLGLLLSVGACETASDARPGPSGDGDTDGDTDGDADGDTDSDTDVEVICDPGEVWCQANWISICNDAGTGWVQQENCADTGLLCAAGECVDTTQECADAINERSYIGCEYWGVTLANGVDGVSFNYAVAVANRGDTAANVNVSNNSTLNNNYLVPAGEMIVISNLPWQTALKDPGAFGSDNWATRAVISGGYHITSDRPVTAYQFSALDYSSGGMFSYTNDASLLLPAHVYRDEYIVMSRPSI